MKQSFAAGLFAAFLAVVLWGVQLPIAKDAFAAVDPFHLTLIRYGIATLFLMPMLAALEGPGALSYRGGFLPATVLGVIGLCASPMLVFLGMAMSRAEHAVVIVALQPAIAAIAQWLVFDRRPANVVIACLLAAFVGVALVVTKGSLAFMKTPHELWGGVLVFSGALCWVVYTMGTSRLGHWSPWRITVLTLIPGTVAILVITEILVFAGYIHHPDRAAVTSVGWEIVYLTFAGVLLAMLAWNFGNRRIGALNATLLINFMPVATFAYRALQGYRFAAIEIFGALLVVAALVTNNLYQRAQFIKQTR